MNKILLIEPYPYLREKYESDESVCIYSNKSIRYWNQSKALQLDICFPNKIIHDMDDIKSKIHRLMPILYRWMGQADTYEDSIRSFCLFIADLAQALQKLEVTHVFFFTGVAHHLEYSFIETASQFAGTKQVFLYSMPFGSASRLLPLIQKKSITDRSILNLDVSNVGYKQDIDNYKQNYLSAKPPQLNESTEGLETNINYAFYKVFELILKGFAKSILSKKPIKPSHPINQRLDYDWASLLRIVCRQRDALNYYASQIISNSSLEALINKEKCLPIILAHYQPEASTFPEGGVINSHLDLVLAIRQAGYDGPILYKEHPGSSLYYSQLTGFSRVGLCRSEEYYKQLAALGCIFIDAKYKVPKKHMTSLFPVTITGSIALERSLIGYATCCGGHPWFIDAPCIYNIDQCFEKNGIFYDSKLWCQDGRDSASWLNAKLSNSTLNNYPGIGTGKCSLSNTDKQDFLNEFGVLVKHFRSNQ